MKLCRESNVDGLLALAPQFPYIRGQIQCHEFIVRRLTPAHPNSRFAVSLLDQAGDTFLARSIDVLAWSEYLTRDLATAQRELPSCIASASAFIESESAQRSPALGATACEVLSKAYDMLDDRAAVDWQTRAVEGYQSANLPRNAARAREILLIRREARFRDATDAAEALRKLSINGGTNREAIVHPQYGDNESPSSAEIRGRALDLIQAGEHDLALATLLQALDELDIIEDAVARLHLCEMVAFVYAFAPPEWTTEPFAPFKVLRKEVDQIKSAFAEGGHAMPDDLIALVPIFDVYLWLECAREWYRNRQMTKSRRLELRKAVSELSSTCGEGDLGSHLEMILGYSCLPLFDPSWFDDDKARQYHEAIDHYRKAEEMRTYHQARLGASRAPSGPMRIFETKRRIGNIDRQQSQPPSSCLEYCHRSLFYGHAARPVGRTD